MAASDYHLCHRCGGKAFYDANVDDDRYLAYFGVVGAQPIGIAVLCVECNKTHKAIILPRQEKQDGQA